MKEGWAKNIDDLHGANQVAPLTKNFLDGKTNYLLDMKKSTKKTYKKLRRRG